MSDILNKNLKAMSYHHTLNIDLIKQVKTLLEIPKEDFEPYDFSKIEHVDGLFLYGLMEGKFLETFFPWLDANPKRRIFVCESNPSKYKHLFMQHDAERIFLKKNVHLLITPDGINPNHTEFVDQIILPLISTFNIDVARFIEHPCEKDPTNTRSETYNKAIDSGITCYHSTLQSLRGHSYKSLVNKLENLSVNKSFIYNERLFEKFKNTPIILCAAGFSLPKVYEKLKSIQSHTLIAAAGTGITLLSKNNIESHFNGILDIDPENENTVYYNNHSGALFYLLRSGCHAVAQHQGLKILCNASVEDPLIRELLGNVSEPCPAPKEGYWTVTDFLLHKLLELGFGPIYLCGVDHVLNETSYYGDNLNANDGKTYSKKFHVETKDIHGNLVQSKVDWLMGSRSMGKLAKMYPETKIYHVTDLGLPIEGTEVLSIEEFNQIEFNTDKTAEDQYLPTLLTSPYKTVDDLEILMLVDNLLQSTSQCRDILSRVELELGRLFVTWQITPIDSLNPYVGIFFELQKQLSQEIVYKYYLEPYWKTCQSQLGSEAGYFDDPQKAKLTLFGLKVRELDYFKSHNGILSSLFSMYKTQILERTKKFDATSQASSDMSEYQDTQINSEIFVE